MGSISIKINKPAKSIGVCEFTLPRFCVVTGINGSGKSHLLGAIANKSISNVRFNNAECTTIRYIQFGQLNPTITDSCDPSEIRNLVNNIWETYNTTIAEIYKYSGRYTEDNSYSHYRSIVNDIEKNQYSGDDPYIRFMQHVSQANVGKHITETDLYENLDLRHLGLDDILTSKLALIFKNYHRLMDSNRYKRYCKEVALTDDEFTQKYGEPPWDLINNVLKHVNIPYTVNNPSNDHRDSLFCLYFEDNTNGGVRIKYSDLSTGEKVLMSLAAVMYNMNTDVKKPDLLLIDEPDVGLHPSMSKNLIEIIKEFIVDKSEIPTIITTHSATTVAALNDDDAIFEKARNIDGHNNSVPLPINKEKALAILTDGVPFLTVSMEKRRPVFVESNYDAAIYTELCEIFKDDIPSLPHFFPFRKRKGDGSNCEDVLEQVDNFVNCGISTVYGIIDHDNDNSRCTKNQLLVLGEGHEVRYAIENFILDPLLVGLLLIDIGKKTFVNFDITTKNTHYDIPKIDEAEAQNIIDHILVDLGKETEQKRIYTLINGWKLSTAESICSQKGHELENLYKERIACLKIYNQDALPDRNMKLQILRRVINGAKEFMPKPVLDTIKQIR